MTTFITGGTSLLGRVVVQELVRQGEAVRILVRPDSNRSGLELPGVAFVRGEIHDLVDVRKGIAGCDWVCHLTGPADANVSEAEGWRIQLEGTRNVLRAAQDIRTAAVVQVSSVIALGPTQPGETADEAHQALVSGQLAAYQKSQRAADDLAREYGAKGLRVKLVYPGFGYGSARAARPSSLLQQTLLRLTAGQAGAIVGSGRNRIAATYLNDVAQGIILAHTHGRPGEGYLLVGESLTLPQMWLAVAGLLEKTPPRRRLPLWLARLGAGLAQFGGNHAHYPADFLSMVRYDWNFSSEKAARDLGWRPYPFREGIAAAWEELQSQGWGGATKRMPAPMKSGAAARRSL
ncbi:MAG: NAD-dependent epimerase/dehydratase family protein [Caldilineaceae bacterium]|nr:NAD-dependent epimerase/dehydratase family protein [Caldilineaceae bacterium]